MWPFSSRTVKPELGNVMMIASPTPPGLLVTVNEAELPAVHVAGLGVPLTVALKDPPPPPPPPPPQLVWHGVAVGRAVAVGGDVGEGRGV